MQSVSYEVENEARFFFLHHTSQQLSYVARVKCRSELTDSPVAPCHGTTATKITLPTVSWWSERHRRGWKKLLNHLQPIASVVRQEVSVDTPSRPSFCRSTRSAVIDRSIE